MDALRLFALGIFSIGIYLTADPSRVEGQCVMGWSPLSLPPGVVGKVSALTVWDPDGDGPANALLVAGGAFDSAGGVLASGIAGWDGESWRPFGSGMLNTPTGQIGVVRALAAYQGSLFAGGEFQYAGGAFCTRIARWTGSTWQPVSNGLGGAYINAMATYDNELVVAGWFSTAGGVAAGNIARWNGSSWQALGSGLGGNSPIVRSLAVFGTDLVVAGDFSTAGGSPAAGIARWDGTAWQAMGTSLATPQKLIVFENQLVVCGRFTVVDGVYTGTLRWNGASWEPFGQYPLELPANSIVSEMFEFGGSLYLFTGLQMARLEGSQWQLLPDELRGFDRSTNRSLLKASITYAGELVVGGDFTGAGGSPARGLARWSGQTWRPIGVGQSSADALVGAVHVYKGLLHASGLFVDAAGEPISRISSWDGQAWRPVGSNGTGAREFVTSGDSLVALGPIEGMYNHLSRWTGREWTAIDDASVHLYDPTTFIEYNSEFVVGGRFNGPEGNHVTRWDGSGWRPLGDGLSGDVYTLAVFQGELIAGGLFGRSGSIEVNHIARWNGSTWSTLHKGMISGPVYDLGIVNGELVAAGDFLSVYGLGSFTGPIARWDGFSWRSMAAELPGSPPAPFGVVSHIVPYDRGLVANYPAQLSQGLPWRLLRWNGRIWSMDNLGANGEVRSLTRYNGRVVVAGSFTKAGGRPAPFLATWGPTATPGDMNCDGKVNIEDADGFAAVLLDLEALGDFRGYLANMNGDVEDDGQPRVDGRDIADFIRIVVNG